MIACPEIVLDIDQTLIHSSTRVIGGRPADFVVTVPAEPSMFVYKRPGVDDFLHNLDDLQRAGRIRVSVWTASKRPYATRILSRLWPSWSTDVHVLRCRTDCTVLPDGRVIKDLRIAFPRMRSVLLIDDNADTHRINTTAGYAVWNIRPFVGGETSAVDLTDVIDFIRSSTDPEFRGFDTYPRSQGHRQTSRA